MSLPAEDSSQAYDGHDGMKISAFLKSMELWIDEVVSRDGAGLSASDREIINKISEQFELALQANIDHFKFMEKNMPQPMAGRHRLMAEIYGALLPARKK